MIIAVVFGTHANQAPSWTSYRLQALEICGDGIDNDNDGNIDEACQAFECDGTLYQSASSGPNYLLYEVAVNPILFNPIANISSNPNVNTFNSLAYNPVDNLMYGMGTNDARLFRIDAAGSVEYLGNVAGLNAFKNGGTFDDMGNYYVYGDNTLRKIDIDNLSFVTIGSPGSFGSADIVFNPVDNMIYGWSGSPKLLFKMDPNNGVQTKIPATAPLAVNSFGWTGALYFNAQGDILGYQNSNMIKIDPQTGIATAIGTGPSKSGNDGCSCSFGVEMTKSVSGNFAPGDTITYQFDFFNQSFNDITASMRFEDILSDGFSWVSNPFNIQNLQLSGNTLISGTNTADFSIDLLPKGTASFSIQAKIPCDYTATTYANQAKLSNLPAPLKDSILSDDPATSTITDPTSFSLTSLGLLIDATVENIICEQNVGSISLNVSGGTPPLSFYWNNGLTTNTATGLGAGNYQISISGATGCAVVLNETVAVENIVLETTLQKIDASCKNKANGSISVVTTSGGYPDYTYSINGTPYSAQTTFDSLLAGNYQLFSVDQYGCTGLDYVTISEPLFELKIEAPADTSLRIGSLLDGKMIQNTLTLVDYWWTPSIGLNCSTCRDPEIIAIETTVYTIVGMDILGCYDTAYFKLEVIDKSSVYIPNAFSPNNDGNNDVLTVYAANDVARVKTFRIFDRWGELVFENKNFLANSPSDGWDGRFNQQTMRTGVYVFVATIERIDGKIEVVKGDVSLLQ